jgi:hypothetical protein
MRWPRWLGGAKERDAPRRDEGDALDAGAGAPEPEDGAAPLDTDPEPPEEGGPRD